MEDVWKPKSFEDLLDATTFCLDFLTAGVSRGEVIGRYEDENEGILIDTCWVGDMKCFETAIVHPCYGKEDQVLAVCRCMRREDSEIEHKKWVEILTKGPLPEQIEVLMFNFQTLMVSKK